MKPKRSLLFSLFMAFLVAAAVPVSLTAQTDTTTAPVQHGPRFVDLNGDGYNDNAPDHDGDGIPNGQDPDWTRPQDGTGAQNGKQYQGTGSQGKGNSLQNGRGIQKQLRDGSCGLGTGVCDGTGPKGIGKGKGIK
jgi:hypothetical protein